MGKSCFRFFGLMLLTYSCQLIGQQYHVGIHPEFPTTSDQITVTVSGWWGSSCVPNRSSIWAEGQDIYFDVYHDYIPDACLTVMSKWTHLENIGPMPEGTYAVNVRQTNSNWTHVTNINVSDHQIVVYNKKVDVAEGQTAILHVRLLNPPRSSNSSVSVSVSRTSGDEDLNVKSGSPLIFDSSNYSHSQMVVLEASEDSDYFSNSASFLVEAEGYLPVTVLANEVDNDVPSIIYVDANAKGTNDGTSWNDAFKELQEALSVARLSTKTNEIRVAAGTYKPASPGGNRNDSFEPVSNVLLKGGYAGVQHPFPDYRNTDMYPTVLSGDLNGDDGSDFTNRQDNALSVIHVEDENTTTLLDGFCISGGGSNDTWGGGGVFIRYGRLVMDDCVVTNNQAHYGAGIHIQSASAEIRNCVIAGNSSNVSRIADGGGIYINSEATIQIESCTIAMNKAGESGGGLSAVFSPIIRNSIIWGNEVFHGPQYTSQIECESYDARYCCIQNLAAHLRTGGNIAVDPIFADSAAGDFHLKSQGGRWNMRNPQWVVDNVTSPCVDAGDPEDAIGLESFANGGIINMGAYGGTGQASKSYFGTKPCETIIAGDVNGDCTVNLADMAILSQHWLEDRRQ